MAELFSILLTCRAAALWLRVRLHRGLGHLDSENGFRRVEQDATYIEQHVCHATSFWADGTYLDLYES